MTVVKKLFTAWLPVGAAFLIGALLVGPASGHGGSPEVLHAGHSDTMAGTLTAKNFRYKTPKVVRYVVPGSAFVAGDTTSVPDHGGYSGQVTVAAGEEAVAAVNLPHGAVVTSVKVWHEVQATDDWELHLEANDSSGSHDDMVSFNAAECLATPCSTTTTSLSPNTVNNKARSYGFWLSNDSGGAITIYRVIITYRTRLLGPASALPDTARFDAPGTDSNA